MNKETNKTSEKQEPLLDLSKENDKLPKEICEAAEEYCSAWSFERKTKERLEKAEAVLRLRMLDKQTMKIKFYDKIEGDFVDFFFKVDTKKVCTSGLE